MAGRLGQDTRSVPGPIPGFQAQYTVLGPRPGPPPDMCRGKLAFIDFFFLTSLKTVQALIPGPLVERKEKVYFRALSAQCPKMAH